MLGGCSKFLSAWGFVSILAAAGAQALEFKTIEDDGAGRRVLLVYDCSALEERVNCTAERNRFVLSDPQELTHRLGAGRGFAEVWLLSGGGALDAGISIADILRQRRMTVRVPNRARLTSAGLSLVRNRHCISSCTVAFMGGVHRFADPETTYEVHASSKVSWRNASSEGFQEFLKSLEKKVIADNDLEAAAELFTSDHPETAVKLFRIFHEALLLPVDPAKASAERRQRARLTAEWLRGTAGRGYAYASENLRRDTAIYALEGRAALQNILMRVERSSMDRAVHAIQRLAKRIGPRAEAAGAMLAAMYDTSSIKETNRVPRETLVKMGYVTEFVKSGP